MKSHDYGTKECRKKVLAVAETAARSAGALLRTHLHRAKRIDVSTAHDIKLEPDVRSQVLITKSLERVFPDVPVLGEEGIDTRAEKSAARWVVDPIDGTVNFAHGIPHAAVSIAFQERIRDTYQTTVGLILDPFMDECWTAITGQPALRNKRRIHVCSQSRLNGAIVSLGFAKSRISLDAMLPVFQTLVSRVRKIRLMGSAALAMAYVADGRFDAYVESGIRLWDIAAGALIVEQAGGFVRMEPLAGRYRYTLQTCTPSLEPALTRIVKGTHKNRKRK